MRLSEHQKLKWPAFLTVSAALFCIIGATQSAQTAQSPTRTGYVTDSAGVLTENTRLQLANILQNIQQKTGIEFAVVTVDSTSGEDIFSYSRKLAASWNVGSRSSAKKGLLLVLAVKDKTWLTQFSKAVQAELPDGVLGEMGHRMQPLIEGGQFDSALNTGIDHFVKSLADKLAMNPSEFEQSAPASSEVVAARTPTEQPSARSPSEEKSQPVPEAVKRAGRERTVTAKPVRSSMTTDDAAESEEVEITLTLPPEARIAKLKSFIAEYPQSKSKTRATELLVSAHAAFGDERLKAGDGVAGVEQMMFAISTASTDASEKLFTGVISQIPLNLYLRGERAAANRAAREIETKFGTDAKRLLAIAGFYLGTEQGGDAVRVATQAVSLAPESAEAHQALALAYHISLRLPEAVTEYKKALELDANSKGARRALADLLRGAGKSEEALNLYRQQVAADTADKASRAGIVLSLMDLGRADEAKTEMDSILASDPKNLPLLAGAAYWFAAHNDSAKALEFVQKALEIEPRYTWVQVAAARALIASNRPLDAERSIRYAQQYGKFPTLDYELATALAAASLFDEAAEILARSFSVKDGYLHTRLAGHTAAQSTNFTELLAPERSASIFQSVSADSEVNAKRLKDLLIFAQLIGDNSSAANESKIVAAALEFASGDDAARVHRQLYAASRLLQKGVGYQTAFELAEAARSAVDAGMTVPAVTVAVQADEYRALRAQAIASGTIPDVEEAPRTVLSNILRGRIEDIAGWARFNQDKLNEAADHLKRAVSVLPEGTPSWRNAVWHLGATLERLDQNDEALTSYIKSYNAGEPDPVRRAVIERLYRKMNGSLKGLDERITGASTTTASVEPPADTTATPAEASASPDSSPVASPAVSTAPADVTPTPSASPELPVETPSPEAAVSPTPEPTPTAAPSPEPVVTSPSLSASPVETINKPRPTVVTITGRVLDAQHNPVASVVVVLIGPQGSVLASTTDAEGKYSFSVAPSSQSYRLIPSKDGFTFEPVDNLLSAVTENQKVDFVAKPNRSP
jgi:tetratricopeptide (TPR) repeat protein